MIKATYVHADNVTEVFSNQTQYHSRLQLENEKRLSTFHWAERIAVLAVAREYQ